MKHTKAKAIPHMVLNALYWSFVTFTTVSIALAMLITVDKRWMQWHLSRLGEGAELPAAIFNFSLCIIGLLVFLLINEIVRVVKIKKPGVRVWPLTIVASVLLVQHFGIAAFPYDRFPNVHDFFGYGIFFVASAMLFFISFIAPYLDQMTKFAGLGIAVLAGIPMVLYQYFNVGTLLIMELYGTAWMYVWFWLIIHNVKQLQGE